MTHDSSHEPTERPADAHGTRPKLHGLSEVALSVRDLDTMVAFYTAVVGLEVVGRSEHMAFLAVVLTDRPQVVALSDRTIPSDHPAGGDTGTDAHPGSLHHVAFAIARSDHHREKERLDELGVSTRAQVHPWADARSLFFGDPEGNVVEFVSYG